MAGSSWQDWKTGKIPNWLLLLGAVLHMFFCMIRAPSSAGCFWLRSALFVGITFPLFLLRMFGAGDIKLMAFLCGCLGIRDSFLIIFYGLAISSVWSFLYMVRRHIFQERILYFICYFIQFFHSGQMTPYYVAQRDGRDISFCLAPFLLCGFCLWWITVKGGVFL